jgi:hypothetical protein
VLGIQLRVETRRVDIALEVGTSVAPEAALHVLPQAGCVTPRGVAGEHAETLAEIKY